jgi:hypothetical protein
MRADLWNILEPIAVDPARKSWKDVLRNLVFHANIEGQAWPSVATIRAETGYKSNKAIIDALSGLKECGLISPAPGSPLKGGRGRPTRWIVNNLSTCVHKLADNSNITERDTISKGEVTSHIEKRVKSLPQKCEPTSVKSEVTSHEIYINKKEVSKLVSAGQNSEVGSQRVDNSTKAGKNHSAEGSPPPHSSKLTEVAPSARNYVAVQRSREPKPISIEQIFPQTKPVTPPKDYLALCSKLGWKPNDPKQTPPEDAEQARRAIVACAYREGLSSIEAKKFLRYNAKRKWAAVDQASCIRDLAKEFCEAWKRRDINAFWEEVDRRRASERMRQEKKRREQIAKEESS